MESPIARAVRELERIDSLMRYFLACSYRWDDGIDAYNCGQKECERRSICAVFPVEDQDKEVKPL